MSKLFLVCFIVLALVGSALAYGSCSGMYDKKLKCGYSWKYCCSKRESTWWGLSSKCVEHTYRCGACDGVYNGRVCTSQANWMVECQTKTYDTFLNCKSRWNNFYERAEEAVANQEAGTTASVGTT